MVKNSNLLNGGDEQHIVGLRVSGIVTGLGTAQQGHIRLRIGSLPKMKRLLGANDDVLIIDLSRDAPCDAVHHARVLRATWCHGINAPLNPLDVFPTLVVLPMIAFSRDRPRRLELRRWGARHEVPLG